MAQDNGSLGWDDVVSEDIANQNKDGGDLVVLPAGEYPFVVHKTERGKFNGSDKLPPCNMVTVYVFVDGGESGKNCLKCRFFMHTKTLWKIYQFLTAVGLHKKGDAAGKIPWIKVTKGLKGRCKLAVDEYNGKPKNEVDEWLAPSAESLGDDY